MPTSLNPTPFTRPSAVDAADSPTLQLQGYTYDSRSIVLPAVAAALESCDCWILERKAVSLTQIAIRFEMQLRSAVDLYSALIGAGLELTRGSHLGLTGLCTVRGFRHRVSEPFRVIEVGLELSFLDELNLPEAILPAAASA